MKLSALNVLTKELGVLSAMKYENKFQVSPRSSGKPLSLEQGIDLIDKTRGTPGPPKQAENCAKRRDFIRFPNYAL